MKSKASFFSLSIFKENIKRFWGISALYTFILALGGFIPLIIGSEFKDHWRYIINDFLLRPNAATVIFLITAPVFVILLVFRYLQSTNSTAVIHALPFSRKGLFATNCISSFVLILIPLIVNMLLLFAIKEPVYYHENVDIFTTTNIINWFNYSFVVLLFNFAIAIFACIITGSMVLQPIFGTGLPFLVPVFIAVFSVYFERFLFGFDFSSNFDEFIFSFSPLLKILNNEFMLSNKLMVIYIIVSAIVLVISYLLYSKRHLETATDSIAFNFLKPVFKYMVAFFGMTLLGLYFMEFKGNTNVNMYVGFLIGSFISYFIAEVILNKTIWVFKNLRGYLYFLIIALAFTVCIQTDILGYESRLPNIEDVKAVYVNLDEDGEGLSDPKLIELAYKYHESIIANKNILEDPDMPYYDSTYVRLTYQYKNDKELDRYYRIPSDFVKNNPYMKDLYESQGYKEKFYDVFSANLDDFAYFDLNSPYDHLSQVRITDLNEMREFLEQSKKDILLSSFEDYNDPIRSICNVNLNYTEEARKILEHEDDYRGHSNVYYAIEPTYNNTVSWLNAHGYLDNLIIEAEDVYYMTVQKVTLDGSYDNVTYEKIERSVDLKELPIPSKDLMVITNNVEIDQVLSTYSDYRNRDKLYYQIEIVCVKDENRNYRYSGYYSEDTVPDFIANYFK